MRVVNLAEPDWTDDTATLVYVPEHEVDELLQYAPPAPAPRLSTGQIVMTVIAALIGAMAAAWSLQDQALSALPQTAGHVTVRALPPAPVHPAVQVAAAVLPPPVAPVAPEVQVAPEAQVVPEAAAAPEAPAAPEVAAVQAVQAASAETQPAEVAPPKPFVHGRARRAASTHARTAHRDRPRPAAVHSEPAPARVAKVAAPPSPPPAPAARTGRLRINSRPWSKVFIDDQPAGTTPQMALQLSPGRHRVTLINDEFQLRRTLSVDVRAGQTVSRSVELLR
jgi:hypothetical protein